MDESSIQPKRHRVLREAGGATASNTGSEETKNTTFIVGTYREPEDFIEAALQVRHPVDDIGGVPPALTSNIKWINEQGPVSISKYRLGTIRQLVKLVEDYKSEEAQLHSSWSPNKQHILCLLYTSPSPRDS